MKLKLFEYAILLHPKDEKSDKDKTVILREKRTLLAKDEKEVATRAAREIDEKHLDHLDRVEILVRPF